MSDDEAEACRSCGTSDLQCDLENFCCFDCNHPWPALDALTRRSSVPVRTIQQRPDAKSGAAIPMGIQFTHDGQSFDSRYIALGAVQIAAIREVLLVAISAESEARYAAGWLLGIESELWLEGGKWRAIGELVGWPSGYEAPWITAAEADRKFGPLSEFLG